MGASFLEAWGAVTGTIGTLTGVTASMAALRRQRRADRVCLELAPLRYFEASRVDPVGALRNIWVGVKLRNCGGRPIAVEHVGFQLCTAEQVDETLHVYPFRGEMALSDPILLVADGPSVKVYTHLGPILALGVDPSAPIMRLWARTSDGREWRSDPPQALLAGVHPPTSEQQLVDYVKGTATSATTAPRHGGLVWLTREKPTLTTDKTSS